MQPQNQPQHQQPQQPLPQPAPVQYPPQKNMGKLILIIVGGLLLVVAALVGGLFLGQSNERQAAQQKIDQANQEIARLEDAYNEATEAIIDEPGVEYLNITEWGIRIPMSDKGEEVGYRIRKRLNADFIELYIPKLIPIATCRDYQGEVATIERAPAGTVPIASAHVVGFDGQLYMYRMKSELCTTNPADLETPLKTALLKQFSKLEKMPPTQSPVDDGNTSTTTNVNPDTPVSSEPHIGGQTPEGNRE